VEWGGATFALQQPPPAIVGAETLDDSTAVTGSPEVPPPPLPQGAVLFAGTRTGQTVTLLPLFEFRGDTILPLTREEDAPGFNAHFAARRLAPGTEFTLFADGVRVGTLVADESVDAPGWCAPRPAARGTPELVPAASGATRFLALARGTEAPAIHARGAFPGAGAEQRRGSLLLAQTAIMRQEALWPDDLETARADLAATRLAPDSAPTVAATFMFRDRLAVEDPGTPVAYSLFVIGSPREDGRHLLDYTWYRRVGDDGKGAPRFFQQFDWDGDGRAEMLLEVMGADARWPAVLETDDDGWRLVHEGRCETGAGPSGG
jgi:hypothetical protein